MKHEALIKPYALAAWFIYSASDACEEADASGSRAFVKDVDPNPTKCFPQNPSGRALSHLWRGGIYSAASWPPVPTRGYFMPIPNISIIYNVPSAEDLRQKVRPERSEKRWQDVKNIFKDHVMKSSLLAHTAAEMRKTIRPRPCFHLFEKYG